MLVRKPFRLRNCSCNTSGWTTGPPAYCAVRTVVVEISSWATLLFLVGLTAPEPVAVPHYTLTAWRSPDFRLFTPVRVNGAGPFSCELDTGVTSLSIDTAVASGANLGPIWISRGPPGGRAPPSSPPDRGRATNTASTKSPFLLRRYRPETAEDTEKETHRRSNETSRPSGPPRESAVVPRGECRAGVDGRGATAAAEAKLRPILV